MRKGYTKMRKKSFSLVGSLLLVWVAIRAGQEEPCSHPGFCRFCPRRGAGHKSAGEPRGYPPAVAGRSPRRGGREPGDRWKGERGAVPPPRKRAFPHRSFSASAELAQQILARLTVQKMGKLSPFFPISLPPMDLAQTSSPPARAGSREKRFGKANRHDFSSPSTNENGCDRFSIFKVNPSWSL
jgi:hypothetical protein